MRFFVRCAAPLGVAGRGAAFTWPLRSWPPTSAASSPPTTSSSSSPCDEDRSPLSRALDPPLCAPLHHINGATGTNCPTLDVLESQIASAASRATSPASAAAAANTNNVNNRGLTFKNTKASSLPLCATVNCWGCALAVPSSPWLLSFDYGLSIQRWHWFRFSFFKRPAPPWLLIPPASAPLLQNAIRRHFSSQPPVLPKQILVFSTSSRKINIQKLSSSKMGIEFFFFVCGFF